MLLFAVNRMFCDAHKFILLYLRTNGELAIKVPNGLGLKCIYFIRGHLFQHFSGCIIVNFYNLLGAVINAFLIHISVQPVTRPQCFNGSLDMVHINQTALYDIALGWPTINNNVQLWVW